MIVASHLRDAAAGGDPDPQPQAPQRRRSHEAAQTATAGLVTLIPEGLVLLMSVTFAVAAVRLAQPRHAGPADEREREPRRGRHDLRRQDRHPDRRASCGWPRSSSPTGSTRRPAPAALGRFAASAGDRNRTLETIAERFPAEAAPVSAEVPFSSEWKWSGAGARRRRRRHDLRARRARRAHRGRRADPAAGARPASSRRRPRPGAASSPSAQTERGAAGRPGARRRAPRLTPLALVVLEETLRPDAAETIAFMREQEVDLKLISGDAAATVTAVAYAVGVPRDAGVVEGPDLPDDPEGLARGGAREHDLLPDQAGAEEGAGRGAGRRRPLRGDDRRRRQRRAGAEAGADGGGDGLRRPGDQGGRRRRPAQRRVRAAAGGGRRGAADRPQHPPPRPPLPDQDRLRGDPDPARRGARLRLPLPPPPPHPGRAADDRHPLLRPRPGALGRAALPRPPAAGAGRLRGPGRGRHRARPRSSPSSSSTPSPAAASRQGAPRRRRP